MPTRTIGTLLALAALGAAVRADPPPALRDSGDCGLDASQKSRLKTRDADGKLHEYRIRSWFEPGILMDIAGDVRVDQALAALGAARRHGYLAATFAAR